jgi:NAD-dependent dihydropyrimidine dehydrogenase PreA subunit
VIRIDVERCTGCGACVEVCPEGAVYLVDGRVAVDRALCRACEACVAACPVDAIAYASQTSMPREVPARVPVVRPEPEVIRVRAHPAPLLFRSKLLPAIGAALFWAGREIVPRLAGYALDSFDRRTGERRVAKTSGWVPDRDAQAMTGDGGRRHRHRARGG